MGIEVSSSVLALHEDMSLEQAMRVLSCKNSLDILQKVTSETRELADGAQPHTKLLMVAELQILHSILARSGPLFDENLKRALDISSSFLRGWTAYSTMQSR